MNPLILSLILGMCSGLMAALSEAIIYNFTLLSPFCLIPLFYAWHLNNSKKSILISTLGYSLVFNSLCFFWIPLSLTEMWQFPLWISIIMFIPIALFSDFQFFIIGYIRKKIYKNENNLTFFFISAIIYASLEKMFDPIFPFGLGSSLYNLPLINQSFDISGVSLLSGLVFITNELFFNILKNKKYNQLIVIFGIYLLLAGYGSLRLSQYEISVKAKSQNINTLIIQPNFNHKIRNSAREGSQINAKKVLDRQYLMTSDGLTKFPDTNFIVWPETTYPFYFNSHTNLFEESLEKDFKFFLSGQPYTLFFGSFGKTGEPVRITNNLYSMTQNSKPGKINHWEKTVLFPFGEYIPGLSWFPWLSKIFPQANTPEIALEPVVNEILVKDNESLKVGAVICYEALFSETLMINVKKEVDLLINISNESYFESFGEPQMNLLMTAIRSIETRTPIARSANTGISAVIFANGEIVKKTKMDTEDVIYQEIPLVEKNLKTNMYSIFGDWFAKIGYFLLAGLIVIFLFRNRNN